MNLNIKHPTFLRRALYVLILLLLALLVAVTAGCAKRGRARAVPPQDEAWHKATALFEREKYYQAQQLLRDFVLNYSGSTVVDSAQFLLGRATFELEEYLTAAEEFRRVVSQYPFSALVGDAAYWEARSYYEQSPSYQLDQTYTSQALEAFQRYLEDYAAHALNDSAYRYIAACRDKLAHKEYAAAKLYYDMKEFASSVLYADEILSNYYDTQWAEPAQYLKARCFDALGNRSRARQEYQVYLERYPAGRHADTARRAVASL